MWIERTVSDRIMQASRARPVLLLTGARQTGKSSLLQKLFPDCEYITFDHLRHVSAAQESPEHFLDQFTNQIILDEIQYVPHLFRELKIQVDKNRKEYGKWILTGSKRFELMENVSESLAGRISIIDLHTLSAQELRNSNIPDIASHVWLGGYPELWSNPNLDKEDFFESYIRTYVERDLKQVIEVRNLSDFQRFVKLTAARVGQLVNYRDFSASVGVSDTTIRKWMHALQMSGIVYLLPPFFTNIGKRLVKSPKLYFADHGLACFLLNIRNDTDWNMHNYKGQLWENFVLTEMIKNHSLTPGKNLFFYRDHNGVEIDFIVEKGTELNLIEAKAGERIDPRKLNFSKVVPLLTGKFNAQCLVAQNIEEHRILRKNDFYCFNPLYCKFPLS